MTIWLWIGFGVLVAGLLALDLGVLHREARSISVREAVWMSLLYIVLAFVFAGGIFWFRGSEAGLEFLTGYLIEKSLSLDNIFVIVLIFSFFAVPAEYQHRVLFWGVLGALALRGVLIFAGVQVIHSFAWTALLFGAFLILTGIKMLLVADRKPSIGDNVVLKILRKRFPVTEDYEGRQFFVRRDGVLQATPLFLVLVMVEFTDLVFAVDSIPAILAITQDPFVVYTSNVFAILGLRALYFALAGIVPRFVYLKYALSLILVVIGGKMIANYLYGGKFIPTELALLVTGVLIAGSIILSLLRTRAAGPDRLLEPTGWVPGSHSEPRAKRVRAARSISGATQS
jgi:tellurite resistance protein TerC